MIAGDFRRRPTPGTALACILAIVPAVACTPVPAPQPPGERVAALDRPPIVKGDTLPRIDLVGDDGRSLTDAAFADRTTVLLFAHTRSGGGRHYRELMRRVRAALERLRPAWRERTQVLVFLLEDSFDALAEVRGALPADADAWSLVVGPPEPLTELAVSLGVIAWETDDGASGYSMRTLVIDRERRIHDWFTGLADWAEGDLLAAIADANRR